MPIRMRGALRCPSLIREECLRESIDPILHESIHILLPFLDVVPVNMWVTPQRRAAKRRGYPHVHRLRPQKPCVASDSPGPGVAARRSLSVILCARHNEREGAYYAEQSEEGIA